MNNFQKTLKDGLYLLDISIYKIILILVLFFISGMLDIVSIGLIGPFIALINNPESASQFFLWDFINTSLYYISGNQMENVVTIFGFVIIVIFFIKVILAYCIHLFIIRFGCNLERDLCNRLMRTYQNLPFLFHVNTNSSSIIQCITRYASIFSNSMVMPALRFVIEIITISALIILLGITNIKAVVVLVVITVLFLTLYMILIKNKLYVMGKLVSKAEESIIKGVQQAFDGYQEISILGKRKFFYDNVKKNTDNIATIRTRYNAYQILPRYFIELIMVAFIVIFMLVLTLNTSITQSALPILSIFVAASIRIIPSINNIVRSINQIKNSKYATLRLFNDLKEIEKYSVNKIISEELVKESHENFKIMHVNSVEFRYPNATQKAIKNISMTIERGNSIGIIGKTGCGKTTLVNIILGLLEPDSGQVLTNNNSIFNDLRRWMNMVAYIPQSMFMIDDTIKNNIALGMNESDIDEELLTKALTMSRLNLFLEKLPDGINTVVGERGVRLSGGERQRIALARAFYFQRQVIIMDEATSSLDNETEKEVIDSILNMKGKVTMIIIAHRLNTVKNCDFIYKLEGGEIIESGVPDNIL